jgi:hypothetical protein
VDMYGVGVLPNDTGSGQMEPVIVPRCEMYHAREDTHALHNRRIVCDGFSVGPSRFLAAVDLTSKVGGGAEDEEPLKLPPPGSCPRLDTIHICKLSSSSTICI